MAVAVAVGCKEKKTSLVVGLESEPMGGTIASLHVSMRVDGALVRDETLRPDARSPLAFPRPWEARLTAPVHGPGVVEVEIDAFDATASAVPLIRRRATTQFVRGRESLLRIGLEQRCLVFPTPPRAPGSPPGPLNGPICSAPETCVRGSCRPDVVKTEQLEAYDVHWASHKTDPCKAPDAGAPGIEVGTGEDAFAMLGSEPVLSAELGPQGGHHVWVALRAHGLRREGSITTISAVEPDTHAAIPPSAFRFPFDPGDPGTCVLYGLRFQLDNGGIDYRPFLGKPLDVTATVTDPDGAHASATARIRVAPNLAR